MTEIELRRLAGSVVMVGFRGLSAGPDSDIRRHIGENRLAGVILFDEHVPTGEHDRNIASPEQLRELTAELQAASSRPLLIAIDQEGGQVARLNSQNGFPQFPSHGEMGEKFEPAETQLTASHIAKALAEAGVNVNFAPVVDLNIDSRNPIIGAQERSFSDDSTAVIDHARSFIAGHREHGVATAIKHFPGHGSSTADTHLSAVDVTESFKDSELTPYRCLINEGIVDMVMVGHLQHRGFDPELPASRSHRPASLSARMIDGMLRREMGFDGVVVTDCMDMAAVAEHYSLQERITLALNAGVDLLLFGNNLVYDPDRPTQVVDAVVAAVRAGNVSEECLREHADRIDRLRESVAGKQ